VTFHSEYAHNLTGIPLGVLLHPTQLYEAGLNFLNFFILFLVLKRKTFHGQVFSLYIINYSVIRYFTEFFRGDFDHKLYAGPLTLSQLICLLAAGASIILLFLWRHFSASASEKID